MKCDRCGFELSKKYSRCPVCGKLQKGLTGLYVNLIICLLVFSTVYILFVVDIDNIVLFSIFFIPFICFIGGWISILNGSENLSVDIVVIILCLVYTIISLRLLGYYDGSINEAEMSDILVISVMFSSVSVIRKTLLRIGIK